MKKTIYDDPAIGFYTKKNFLRFIDRKGAQSIYSVHAGFEMFIYHLNPPNVTLSYIWRPPTGNCHLARYPHAEIIAFSSREGISQIEKIILKAAEKYSKNK